MTKALKNRLNILKQEKEIITQNTITLRSYSKLEKLGLCTIDERQFIKGDFVLYEHTIKIK